ncbi:MAG: hypothetical protein U0W40_05630 [Acidimicrobiia bacterium]
MDELLVGALGVLGHARVSTWGRVAPGNVSWQLDWWIGADDRWHTPATEAAVRQSLVDSMPVVRTAMRIPGGDAVHQVAAVPEPDELAVVDVTNDSPGAFVLALVIRDAASVEIDGATVYIDGRPALRPMRVPSRWATGSPEAVQAAVTGGTASDGDFVPVSDPAGHACAALLFPLAHRTTFRCAVALDARGMHPLDPVTLPAPEQVARGWRAQLARGLRVELPEVALLDALDAARAQVLLAGQVPGTGPAVVAALEDWGFDTEASEAWSGLSRRERKQAGERRADADWDAVRAGIGGDPAALLLAARGALLRETDDLVEVFPAVPDEWRGAALDVRDAPTRHGPVSCSVRWHGERPALLWDAPAGVTVRAPGLDGGWASTEPTGEALLGGAAAG